MNEKLNELEEALKTTTVDTGNCITREEIANKQIDKLEGNKKEIFEREKADIERFGSLGSSTTGKFWDEFEISNIDIPHGRQLCGPCEIKNNNYYYYNVIEEFIRINLESYKNVMGNQFQLFIDLFYEKISENIKGEGTISTDIKQCKYNYEIFQNETIKQKLSKLGFTISLSVNEQPAINNGYSEEGENYKGYKTYSEIDRYSPSKNLGVVIDFFLTDEHKALLREFKSSYLPIKARYDAIATGIGISIASAKRSGGRNSRLRKYKTKRNIRRIR